MFVKVSQNGVKSRLAASIGRRPALELYRRFVDDLLSTLRKSGYPFIISFYPPDAGAKIKGWLGTEHTFMPQSGEDLGERMKNAFVEVFSEGFESALLIGSDIPGLPKTFADDAFAALDDHDTVIGPSLDGGYYLIGFNRHTFAPVAFEGIEWSTPGVFARTIGSFRKLSLRFTLLPFCRDIDTIDDLKAFYSDRSTTDLTESATMKFLARNARALK
jgi:uncharacterized protein